jgi:hypothetical protein
MFEMFFNTKNCIDLSRCYNIRASARARVRAKVIARMRARVRAKVIARTR